MKCFLGQISSIILKVYVVFFPGTHDTNIPWRNVTLVCFRGSIIVNMSEETGSRCYPLNQKCDIHLPCPRNISFSCYGEYINKILLNLHAYICAPVL